MSSVPLRLRSLVEPAEAPRIHWTLDCPTRGVVILDVAVGQGASDAPLHWRAGDWTKPPLDVQLSDVGAVEGIQFVFQDEAVDVGEVVMPADAEVGLPTFDVGQWPADRYTDAHVEVRTVRLQSGELYAAIGNSQLERVVSVTWGLRLGFDSSDQLAGIALGPLTTEEWQVVEASAPPTGG